MARNCIKAQLRGLRRGWMAWTKAQPSTEPQNTLRTLAAPQSAAQELNAKRWNIVANPWVKANFK